MDALPAPIREKCCRLLSTEYADVVEYFLKLDAAPRAPAAASAAAAAAASADTPAHAVSQILPARKQVDLQVGAAAFTTSAQGVVLSENAFAEYNVLLCLPPPKRTLRPVQYVVLTSLNQQAAPFIFAVPEPAVGAVVAALAAHTKYSSADPAANSRLATAYVGAREGTLYLLDDFLFFGFKKPLVLLLLAEIESVSFTLVTSRTFNLVVKLLDDTTREFEKIDHKHYDVIMEYIASNNLNDESLAEERRAKRQRKDGSDDDDDDEDVGNDDGDKKKVKNADVNDKDDDGEDDEDDEDDGEFDAGEEGSGSEDSGSDASE